MTKRKREHTGTLADKCGPDGESLILRGIGTRPKNPPYLWIGGIGAEGRAKATIDNSRSLRALAHAILRSLGDE